MDALKGWAIFLVLWGHSIQYLKDDYDFFNNPIFSFIYSFHMPLFFFISGFFFHSSLKLNLKYFLVKKTSQLLLPCLSWAVIYVFMTCLIAMVKGHGYYVNNLPLVLKDILNAIGGIWFLRELFVSYLIAYSALKICRKEGVACILSLSFVLASPFLCEIQRVLLPIFWGGFFLSNYYQFLKKYAKQTLIYSALIFAICLAFWNGNHIMYVTKFPSVIDFSTLSFNLKNIEISIFRLIIGLCGSVFFIVLFEMVYSNNTFFTWLTKIGANTLAIYLLQRLLLEDYLNYHLNLNNVGIWEYTLLITPLISVVILLICFIISESLKRIKYVNFLLFGK